MNQVSHHKESIENIVLQCTTRELSNVLYLLCTLPRPDLHERETRRNLIIFTDIHITSVEEEIIKDVASQVGLSRYYNLLIESSGQNAATSVYCRGVTSPCKALKFGRKNGPNQSFFDLLRLSCDYSADNHGMTLLVEPDCVIRKPGWVALIEEECRIKPGLLLYGCKPQINLLPKDWDDEFKAKFIQNHGNRFNGVATYNTAHPYFVEFLNRWENLLVEYAAKIDPACAFDTLPSALSNFINDGRKTDVFTNPAEAKKFLHQYYHLSCALKSIIDASAYDFGGDIEEINSYLDLNDASILHTKLTLNTLNQLFDIDRKISADSLSPDLIPILQPSTYLKSTATKDCTASDTEIKLSTDKLIPHLFKRAKHIFGASQILVDSVSALCSNSNYEPRFLFTIVTVNYNNATGLIRTINSVKSQKYKNYQYIVIDAGSTDESMRIIDENISSIDIALSEKDDGVYYGMNKGLDMALGQYILFLNSGDCLHRETTLLDISDVILSNPSLEVVYGDTITQGTGAKWHANDDTMAIWKGMICSHQSIFIATCLARQYRFDQNLAIVADWKMIMESILGGAIAKKVKFCIGCIEPVGISSDFVARTLERWKIMRQRWKNKHRRLKEVDQYYNSVLASQLSNTQNSKTTSNTFSPTSTFEDKLIFLISMPRSGSTLLQRILESSSLVGSCGEPWVALPPVSLYDPNILDAKYELKLAKHAAKEAFAELELEMSAIERAQKSYLASIYSDLLDASGAKYFLDKTPRYIHIVDELYQLLPNAKYVILTRDPSALINSYASTWCHNDYSVLLNHKSYMYDFCHGLPKLVNFIEKGHPNVMTLSYEALCRDADSICSDLSSFLGFTVHSVIRNSERAIKRSLGDPKQINNTDRINAKSAGNLGKQDSIKHHPAFDKICHQIPESVWTYFKERPSNQGMTSLGSTRQISIPIIPSSYKSNHSIIITSYNNSKTILAAIDSALNQVLPPEEIIVIDDCSTDGSTEVIQNYIKTSDYNIKLLQNNRNIGVSSSRHKAICACNCDYISTLDGDDTISSLKIAMEMNAIKRFQVDVAFSDISLLTHAGSELLDTRPYHQQSPVLALTSLLTRSHPVPRDLTFSRRIYEKTGGFEPSFNLFEDWMFKQRLAVFAGSQGWAHSGVYGTIYDRRSPGLSNKRSLVLVYAQILAIIKNWTLLDPFSLDFVPILKMLAKIEGSSPGAMQRTLELAASSGNSSRFIRDRFVAMHREAESLPSYTSDERAITNAINTYFPSA